MRILLGIICFIALVVGIWWLFLKEKSHTNEPRQQPLIAGVHSAEFNQSVEALVTAYIDLKDAFVNADTSIIKAEEKKLINSIDSLKINDLKKDTNGIFQSAQLLIGDIRSNANSILKETDISEMRQDFRMVSENIFPLLKTIHYEGKKLYWQNCPMAFGEGKDANWLSNKSEIMNPYLGKNHPEFKSTMLHCGEIKDTIQ